MYCSHCRRQLYYKNLSDCGWCENCGKIVHVSQCKVSYWYVAAVFMSFWAMPNGIGPW
jgi:hypothetical protein